MRFRQFIFSLVVLWPTAAQPVVIRHDVADAQYLAEEADYPFLFALYHSKKGFRDCVATLIAPQWAITAAHCTRNSALLRAIPPGGAGYPVSIAGQTGVIDRVERHPNRNDGKQVDIALLHLKHRTQVHAIALYREKDEIGRVVLLPGWGQTGNGLDGLGVGDDRFRVAENRIDAALDGRLVWDFDDPRSLTGAALSLEGVSGPGDSGGPALIMTSRGWAVAGISMAQRTFGRPEGLYNAEEIYARVSDFAGWIDATVAAG